MKIQNKREHSSLKNVDDLTGLPTKEQHKAEAVHILQGRQFWESYAYVACDIVDFKLFNETYGYAFGNVALKYMAAAWQSQLRRNELLSRTTQDKFCLMLRYTDIWELQKRLFKMMDSVAEFPVNKETGHHRAAFRCGIYLIHGEEDINMIRSRADMARKRLEKNSVSAIAFYSDEDLTKELERRELETELRQALREKELLVYFQPKYNILKEKIDGAEALVRWQHPQKGMMAPGSFIPLCEENGFICEVDFFVFEEVCRQMLEWKKQGRALLKISVNFSRLHLYDPEFVDKLMEITEAYHINPSLLEIELTESAAYHEMDTLLVVMRKIKSAGFGLSMDDFGSGYSSLNLLRKMPVDVLKLDKEFLDDCAEDDSSREKRIIAHIISMAKDLDIAVLAEGVETARQKEFLKESRCDMIQGYYYAKPMPTQQFTAYLEHVSA